MVPVRRKLCKLWILFIFLRKLKQDQFTFARQQRMWQMITDHLFFYNSSPLDA